MEVTFNKKNQIPIGSTDIIIEGICESTNTDINFIEMLLEKNFNFSFDILDNSLQNIINDILLNLNDSNQIKFNLLCWNKSQFISNTSTSTNRISIVFVPENCTGKSSSLGNYIININKENIYNYCYNTIDYKDNYVIIGFTQ